MHSLAHDSREGWSLLISIHRSRGPPSPLEKAKLLAQLSDVYRKRYKSGFFYVTDKLIYLRLKGGIRRYLSLNLAEARHGGGMVA